MVCLICSRCTEGFVTPWGRSSRVLTLKCAFLPSPKVFFVESVCDDPEVIAANILVRAALPGPAAAVGTRALSRCKVTAPGACGDLCKRLPLTFHLGNKQLGFAGLLKVGDAIM